MTILGNLQIARCSKVVKIFCNLLQSLRSEQKEEYKFRATVSAVSAFEKVWQWGDGGRCSPKPPGWQGEVWRRWSPSRSGGRAGRQDFGLFGGFEGGKLWRSKISRPITMESQTLTEAFPTLFWSVTWECWVPFTSLSSPFSWKYSPFLVLFLDPRGSFKFWSDCHDLH